MKKSGKHSRKKIQKYTLEPLIIITFYSNIIKLKYVCQNISAFYIRSSFLIMEFKFLFLSLASQHQKLCFKSIF